jgi:hypothetical protein
MIDHVREQMERRVVEVVGIGYDLSDVFPCDALDPRVVNDVRRIVNSKKTQPKVACVKNGGRQNAEENDSGI